MLDKLFALFFKKSQSSKTQIVRLIIISSICTLAYLNILSNTFILDDLQIFFSWPEMQSFSLQQLAQGAYPTKFKGEPAYRPLKSIIHAVEYKAFNNNINAYHLQAIIINILITLLVFGIINFLTKNNAIAFVASILFSALPVKTEAITFLTASFDTIGILFFFLSFYLYLKWTEKRKSILLLISIFMAGLAFFTYELTLSLILLIPLYNLCFLRDEKKINLVILPHILLIIIFFYLRLTFLPGIDTILYFGNSMYLTFLAMLKALIVYIQVIIAPYNLSFNHMLPGNLESAYGQNPEIDYQTIVTQSIFDPSSIFGIGLIISSIILFFKYLKKKPVISFAIGWFFISLIPASNVIPLIQILAERYIFISSMSYVLILGYIFIHYFNKFENSKAGNTKKLFLLIILLLTVTIYSITTHIRNNDYRDQIKILSSQASITINGYAANYQLGKLYFFNKDYVTSTYYLKQFISTNYSSFYKDANYYLALSYVNLSDFENAQKAYDNLIKANPNFDNISLSLLKEMIQNKRKNSNLKPQIISSSSYSDSKYSFSYPQAFILKKEKENIKLIYNATNIDIKYTKIQSNVNPEQYIQNDNLGKVKYLQEGRANIPSAQFAYVRILEEMGIRKAKFYIFNSTNMLEIFINPFDSSIISNLNLMLNSIKFKAN